MKALIGVDVSGDSHVAIDLFRRLRFPVDQVTLIHAVESVLPDGSFPGVMSPGVMGDILDQCEKAGRDALDAASVRLGEGGVVDKKLVLGDPYKEIAQAANAEGTDLIVVYSHGRSALEAFITGSVTRGLLTGSSQSFLAAKPGFRAEGPLTALLMNDQSEYSKRCIEELIRLAPQGIGKIVVATVLDNKMRRDLATQAEGTEMEGNAALWAEDRLGRENMQIASRLESVAPERSEAVVGGEINAAISELMREHSADLLIMGAQGHGFFDRLRSGSVSFYQVTAGAYPVLLLRAQAKT